MNIKTLKRWKVLLYKTLIGKLHYAAPTDQTASPIIRQIKKYDL
jgi:hypothetical protein